MTQREGKPQRGRSPEVASKLQRKLQIQDSPMPKSLSGANEQIVARGPLRLVRTLGYSPAGCPYFELVKPQLHRRRSIFCVRDLSSLLKLRPLLNPCVRCLQGNANSRLPRLARSSSARVATFRSPCSSTLKLRNPDRACALRHRRAHPCGTPRPAVNRQNTETTPCAPGEEGRLDQAVTAI